MENNFGGELPTHKSPDASGQPEVRGVTLERARKMLRDAFEVAQQGATPDHPNLGALRELRTFFETPEGEALGQGALAEQFFADTIGQNIGNTRGAYPVYMALKGTPFSGVFGTLEDRRLKEAGYPGGFQL